MAGAGKWFQGLALGAGYMYFFDPDRGRRRRAWLRDQAVHLMHSGENFVERGMRDLEHRVQGMAAAARHRGRGEPPADPVLVERIHSKLGRYSSHPHAIRVEAHDGRVTLTGPILAPEVEKVVSAARSVPGVREVINSLEPHEHPANIPALQGGRRVYGERFDIAQENWSPATRLVMSAAGGLMALKGLQRRTLPSLLLGTLGFGMLLRATTNVPARKLLGVSGEPGAVHLRRSFHIGAPLERVFDLLSDLEESARFMPHVCEVRRLDGNHVRWTMALPTGQALHLDEEITDVVPNERIEWKSVPGAPIAAEGAIRFQRENEDSTRVDVDLSYTPVGGLAGHAVAAFFRMDPKTELVESIIRIKTFLETGRLPHDVAAKAEPAPS